MARAVNSGSPDCQTPSVRWQSVSLSIPFSSSALLACNAIQFGGGGGREGRREGPLSSFDGRAEWIGGGTKVPSSAYHHPPCMPLYTIYSRGKGPTSTHLPTKQQRRRGGAGGAERPTDRRTRRRNDPILRLFCIGGETLPSGNQGAAPVTQTEEGGGGGD